MSTDSKPASPVGVALVGEHRHAVTFQPGAERKVAELAARIVADEFQDRGAYTPERAQTHINELAKLVRVSCTCGRPNCAIATTYVRGLLEGMRRASINAMAAGLGEQLRARRDSAPLLPPEIKLTLPKEVLSVLVPGSKEITVKRHPDGSSTATIQQR